MYNTPINNNQNRRINKKSATSRHNLLLGTTFQFTNKLTSKQSECKYFFTQSLKAYR